MAAGLGFKTFANGDVLTANDTNGYLMQGVLVFADATARDAAITSPQEGQFAYLKDTNVTTYYTGSAWANLDTTGTKYESTSYRYRTKNGVIVNQIQANQIEGIDIVQTQNRIEVRNIPLQTSPILSLYSLDGKKITEKKLTTSDCSLVLDKVSGIVIAHLNADGKISTKKIAIQ